MPIRAAGLLARLMMVLGVAFLGACEDPPKARTPAVQPLRDVPSLLRGTIGSEVVFQGIEPTLVSGYGLVVGLKGTGGDVLPDNVAASMEREMGLMGIGKANEMRGTAIEGKTPRQLLRDPSVAVVVVQAAVPPGAPAGATFDVYVRAMNAKSLEGGTLWTTALRIGDASAFGQAQARQLGNARGPIFINPFAEPGKEENGVTKTSGRVLDGGVITAPLQIDMLMAVPSFQRARSIVSAINSRFPEGPGDIGPTARGRSGPDEKTGVGGSILLRVPDRFRKTAAEFLQVVRHIQIDTSAPEQYARRYVEGMKAEPYLCEDAAWCLEAIGQKSIPFIRELYDYPELAPRIAALKAGSRLNDPRAAAPLKDIIKTSQGAVRNKAIELLGAIDAGPTVDEALRDLLNEQELVVRINAYEALAKRSERESFRRQAAAIRNDPDHVGHRVVPSFLEVLASREFSGNTLQGIERRVVEDKFLLDTVPFGDPLIYITQQGTPRIVLFGSGVSLSHPAVVTAWSNRLMIVTEQSSDDVRAYYRPSEEQDPIVLQAKNKGRLADLVAFLARKTTAADPRPGLNLSYSEVVGALHAVFICNATPAAFTTETDKLKAQLLAAAQINITERPETPDDRDVVIFKKPAVIDIKSVPQPDNPEKPKIVPIVPPPK